MPKQDANKQNQDELMAFLNLLDLNGERLSDVPVWSERMQEVFAQLPEHVVDGFVQRIKSLDGRPVTDFRAFSQRFGLTPTEAKMLDALSLGLSTKEYAAKYNVSVNTARVHMQRILEKTEAKSQTDLLRMLYTS